MRRIFAVERRPVWWTKGEGTMRLGMQIAALMTAGLVVAGCSSLPAQGPTASEVVADATPAPDSAQEAYLVVDLDGRVADVLASRPNVSLV